MTMNKEILRLAIPNILSNVSVPLLSTVDTALMGHLSASLLGAVGLGGMIFNLIYWNFGFLRMGTTGMTAQAYGRQDKEEIANLLVRSLIIALGIGFVLLLLQNPFEGMGMWFFKVDGDQISYVATYFNIRIWAAPATLALYVLFGWLFGMQNALYPLILTIVINGINIVLSIVFIQYYGMEIEGVAWGTVIAQYVGLILAVVLILLKYGVQLRQLSEKLYRDTQTIRAFFNVNKDLFIRTLCLTFAFAFFYRQSSAQGAILLAVNVILLQLIHWMSYAIDGFAYAAESLVGKYKGAEDHDQGNKAIRYIMIWGLGSALMFSVIYALWSEPIFRLFTDQEGIVDAARPYLWYMIAFPLAGFICYIWDGIFIGLTASVTMRNTMLFSLVLYLSIYFLLYPIWGVHGLWVALLLFLIFRGGIQSVYFRRYGWEIR